MNRSEFLKSLLGISALAVSPKILAQMSRHYEKVYLKQFFVRGFQYYEGPNRIDEINKMGMVELVREPNNKFDKRAIALYFNGFKIGYLPRESNKTMSILMDTQLLDFHAEISHIKKNASDWEKINVAVYVLKEIKSATDLNQIKAYQVLKTPQYYTLKTENNKLVTKIDCDKLPVDESGFEFSTKEPLDIPETFVLHETAYLEKMETPLSTSLNEGEYAACEINLSL